MSISSDSQECLITIDHLCDAYESARRRGRPDHADYLEGIPDSWKPMLASELQAIDEALDCRADREPDGMSHGSLQVGSVWLNRFEIEGVIGSGGNGNVWRAFDRRLSRRVALKTPHLSALGVDSAVRFDTEARAAAAISHPGVVQIHETLVHDGMPVLIQQYIDGKPLSESMSPDHPLPFKQTADWMRQIADAVACAHDHGVVHRDLKPANVMIDDGRPIILDFGLASCPRLSPRMTAEGSLMGTPAYMSPEQSDGSGGYDQPSTDVYSLGAILYEMLVGGPPFRGTTSEILRSLKDSVVVAPRKIRVSVPRDLETITLRCLNKHPGARYGSAAELRDDLDRYLRGEPIRARRVSAVVAGWRWCRSRPVAALVAVGLPIILGLSIAWSASLRERVRLKQQSDRLRVAEAANRRERDELKEQMSFVQLARASQELSRGDPKRAAALLRGLPRAHRGWEWNLLQSLSEDSSRWVTHGAFERAGYTIAAVAASRSGEFCFSASFGGRVVRWERSMGDPADPPWNRARLIEHAASRINRMRLSPDERWLVWIENGGRIVIWDVEGDSILAQWDRPDKQQVFAVSWSQDSRKLVVGGGRSRLLTAADEHRCPWLQVISVDEADFGTVLANQRWDHASPVTAVQCVGDDRFLVGHGTWLGDTDGRTHGRVDAYRLISPETIPAPTGPGIRRGVEKIETLWQGFGVLGFDFHAPTNQVVWCDRSGLVHLYDVEHQRFCRHFNFASAPIRCVRFSPDGREIAAGGHDGVVTRWNVACDTLVRRYQGHRQPVFDLGWIDANSRTPDDDATDDDVADGKTASTISSDKQPTTAKLISCGSDGTVRTWKHGVSFPGDSLALECDTLIDAQWSVDGKHVYVSTKSAIPKTTVPTSSVLIGRALGASGLGTASVAIGAVAATADRGPTSDFASRVVRRRFAHQPIEVVEVRADAPRQVSASVSTDRYSVCQRDDLTVFDATSDAAVGTFPLSSQSVFSSGVIGDRYVVTCHLDPMQCSEQRMDNVARDSQVKLFQVATGRMLDCQTIPGAGLSQEISLSPDEGVLAVCCQARNRITLIPIETGTDDGAAQWGEVFSFHAHDRMVSELVWSADGKFFATVSWDGTCGWWRVRREGDRYVATQVHRIQASNRPLTSVSITPDRQYLATCGDDRIVRIWNANSGIELLSLAPQPGKVAKIRFSPDGGYLLIAMSDGRLTAIELDSGQDSSDDLSRSRETQGSSEDA